MAATTNALSSIIQQRAAAGKTAAGAVSKGMGYTAPPKKLQTLTAEPANQTAKKNLNALIRSTAKAPVKSVKQQVSGETTQKMTSPLLPKIKPVQAMAKFKAANANSKVNVLNRTVPLNFRETDLRNAAAAAVQKRRKTVRFY